jgi:hypothetical protein
MRTKEVEYHWSSECIGVSVAGLGSVWRMPAQWIAYTCEGSRKLVQIQQTSNLKYTNSVLIHVLYELMYF